jgi:hypothetical protein
MKITDVPVINSGVRKKLMSYALQDYNNCKDRKHQVHSTENSKGKTWLTASPKATKANSPPGASKSPVRTAAMVEIPNNLPVSVTNNVFPIINRLNIREIAGKFDINNFGSIDIPTWKGKAR